MSAWVKTGQCFRFSSADSLHPSNWWISSRPHAHFSCCSLPPPSASSARCFVLLRWNEPLLCWKINSTFWVAACSSLFSSLPPFCSPPPPPPPPTLPGIINIKKQQRTCWESNWGVAAEIFQNGGMNLLHPGTQEAHIHMHFYLRPITATQKAERPESFAFPIVIW